MCFRNGNVNIFQKNKFHLNLLGILISRRQEDFLFVCLLDSFVRMSLTQMKGWRWITIRTAISFQNMLQPSQAVGVQILHTQRTVLALHCFSRFLFCWCSHLLYVGLSRWCNTNLSMMTFSAELIWGFYLVEKAFNSQLSFWFFG